MPDHELLLPRLPPRALDRGLRQHGGDAALPRLAVRRADGPHQGAAPAAGGPTCHLAVQFVWSQPQATSQQPTTKSRRTQRTGCPRCPSACHLCLPRAACSLNLPPCLLVPRELPRRPTRRGLCGTAHRLSSKRRSMLCTGTQPFCGAPSSQIKSCSATQSLSLLQLPKG